MTQQYTPNLGEQPGPDARRDAVHVAVAPMVARHVLEPGDAVAIHESGQAISPINVDDDPWGRPRANAVGIVDPFLTETVHSGQRFWLFLFPGTVTGMRHQWTHHAFARKDSSDV